MNQFENKVSHYQYNYHSNRSIILYCHHLTSNNLQKRIEIGIEHNNSIPIIIHRHWSMLLLQNISFRCVHNVRRCVQIVCRCVQNVRRCVQNVCRCVQNICRCVQNIGRCVQNVCLCVQNVCRCVQTVYHLVQTVKHSVQTIQHSMQESFCTVLSKWCRNTRQSLYHYMYLCI